MTKYRIHYSAMSRSRLNITDGWADIQAETMVGAINELIAELGKWDRELYKIWSVSHVVKKG